MQCNKLHRKLRSFFPRCNADKIAYTCIRNALNKTVTNATCVCVSLVLGCSMCNRAVLQKHHYSSELPELSSLNVVKLGNVQRKSVYITGNSALHVCIVIYSFRSVTYKHIYLWFHLSQTLQNLYTKIVANPRRKNYVHCSKNYCAYATLQFTGTQAQAFGVLHIKSEALCHR